MAWIESHQELEKHPKVLMLMSLMGWSKDTTIGKLHRFWWWCVSYAEDGDLRKYHVDQIGAAVDLAPGKESSLFANNMVKAKWIDLKPYLRVHDWWHYIGRFLQVKYKLHPEKWEKVRALYTDGSNNPPNNGGNNHIPNLTLPNQTKPKKKQPYWAAFKESSQEQLKVVNKEFNIYQFLTKLKKDKQIEIPEEVINRICASYAKNKAGIKDSWPWFIVTTQKEWEAWNAEQQIREGQEWKKTPVSPAIAQILAGMKIVSKS
jgi:hypothetical protein